MCLKQQIKHKIRKIPKTKNKYSIKKFLLDITKKNAQEIKI